MDNPTATLLFTNHPFKALHNAGLYHWETTMPKNDIVYILKPDIVPDELRYSLRSIEKNFPHRKVWFVCGQPEGFEPDGRIVHRQTGNSKWEKIKSSMWEVINNDEVTDDFFLFNDDFFVMKPFKGEFVNYVDRTLTERVEELRAKVHKWLNPYGRTLLKAQQELETMGCSEWNFEVHMPMLFNKALAADTINRCTSPQMRSVYGNINRVPHIDRPDVKIYDLNEVPPGACTFLSTNDDIFKYGKVGEVIRKAFPERSRFETDG